MQAGGTAECGCWDRSSLERRVRLSPQQRPTAHEPRYHLVIKSDQGALEFPLQQQRSTSTLTKYQDLEHCVVARLIS